MWSYVFFFFSSRRRHTRWNCDWSSDVCSSDLGGERRWYPAGMSESTAPAPAPRSDTGAEIAGDAASPLTASPETTASSSTDLTTTRLGLAEQLDGQRQALLEVAEAIALRRVLGELFHDLAGRLH